MNPTPANTERAGLPIHELVSWPPLLAASVLALNDHVFKAEFAGWWTGKLSDVTGLFYFPLLLTAGSRLGVAVLRRAMGQPFVVPALTRTHLLTACVTTGLAFTAINLSPSAMATWSAMLSILMPSRGTVDPTDLLALPMLAVAFLWGQRFVGELP